MTNTTGRFRFRAIGAAAVILFLPITLHAQVGNSGMAFLKLGISGRGVGLADALTASASGTASLYYNPAGTVRQSDFEPSTQFMFTHKEWIQDTRVEFLGGVTQLGPMSALGAFVTSTTIADIEVRTRPGEAEGTFTARNMAAGVSYAYRLSDHVSAGVTAKFLYEKIFVDEASGFAADLGVQVDTPVENLKAGFALSNLGGMSPLRSERTTLPSLLRAGGAYNLGLSEGQFAVLGATDLVYIFPEGRAYLNAGAELRMQQFLAVRLGYQFGSEARGLCAGLGVGYGAFGLDYAYGRLSSDLGTAHTLSLIVNL